ncbi:MAG: hypothetical protein BWY23_01488 [Spirochaetes bacterium ADurb.Bin218]|jgi:hypothetical protein|nr:MAG: hypothetical protein BWY23_01488 [Spirochaetes bacterium ADurb.Bin218]HOQ13181.1 hypothetical protein [Spirochaetota bacterium]HOV09062.1 hypothetical protein [Spirochaetota bacterium]
MDSIEKQINDLITSHESDSNLIEGIYLDDTLSEFYRFNNEIEIPSLAVSEITKEEYLRLSSIIINLIPEFLKGHEFSSKRFPSYEQHSLHFIKRIEGKIIDFIHLLRINFKQSSRGSRIIQKGDSLHYPSYSTDKLYFKSLLIPIHKGSDNFKQIKLKEEETIESDGKRFTSAIFDELSTKEISIEFSKKIGLDVFTIPSKIYPFISYDFFTAVLNIPDPFEFKIAASAEIYEPIFLFLYLTCKNFKGDINPDDILKFIDSIKKEKDTISLTPGFLLNIKDYFSAYSFLTEEELLLRGWKKFSTG